MNFYGEMYLEFDRRFVKNGHLVSDDPLPIKVFIDDLIKNVEKMPGHCTRQHVDPLSPPPCRDGEAGV